jgi:two-component system response regulator HydG
VRELRNAIERAVLLATDAVLGPEAFPLPRSAADERAPGELPFPATMREITRAAASAMVNLCGGNKSDAARRLGISRARLLRTLDLKTTIDDDLEESHE